MAGKKKILVVDDEKVVSDFLIRLLKLESFEVKAADSGLKAIQAAREDRFDLIFLDVRMPKMDGLETLRELKKIAPDAKYVMMTGYAVDNLLEEAKKEGVVISLKKPFDISELNAVLKTICGRRR